MPISNESIEREGGIFEKILNQSFTLPNGGYDVRTSLPFSLNRHLASHNHHEFHFFSIQWPRVSMRSRNANSFSKFFFLFRISSNPINKGFLFLFTFFQTLELSKPLLLRISFLRFLQAFFVASFSFLLAFQTSF
jgi:hypothetical protein